MKRLGSFVAAAGIAAVALLVVLWGGGTEGRSVGGLLPALPATPAAGEIVLAERPPAAEGALGQCVVCHAVAPGEAPRAAPDLDGIVGAEKAASPWFNYSKALRAAGGGWSEDELDKYLAHPASFLPGTKKTIVGIAEPEVRRDIIEALKATARN